MGNVESLGGAEAADVIDQPWFRLLLATQHLLPADIYVLQQTCRQLRDGNEPAWEYWCKARGYPCELPAEARADGAAATSAQRIAFDSTTSSVDSATSSVRNAFLRTVAEIQKMLSRLGIRATGGRRRALLPFKNLRLWQ